MTNSETNSHHTPGSFDNTQAENLLSALWRSDRIHQIGTLDRDSSRFKNLHVGSVASATVRIREALTARHEVYFACAEYQTPLSRIASNTTGAWAFWLDIDCGEGKAESGKGYATENDARDALRQFSANTGLPDPTHIVSSGGGLHVYWVLIEFVPREEWQRFAGKLKAITRALKFLADDTRTADIASVLRVPGTLNFKYEPPRPVTLLHTSHDYIENSRMFDAIDHAHAKHAAVDARPDYPETCHFVAIPEKQKLEILGKLLEHTSSDCSYADWCNVLMAVHHETSGSDEGFELADSWSSKGKSYKGTAEIRTKWRSFAGYTGKPITIGTLIMMAKGNGADVRSICALHDDPFEVCKTEVIHPGKNSSDAPVASKVISNPLDKFSLLGMSDELEKNVVNTVPLLGELALMGQATVLFAAPNTGKTMITISLLIDAIKEGRVDPAKVYYLNMDDSGTGLLEKNRIAEEFGFHMLAEGHRDFSASAFLSIVRGMVEEDQARGTVLVLDTLKKFVDLMDKGRTSTFTNVIRPFVMKGGTVIALAHTNKHPGKDGNPVYGGVSDILNDIDCAYTIAPISSQDGKKVIEFTNIKRRGDVAQTAGYSYSFGNGLSYNETLLSVELVEPNALEPIKQAEAIKSDGEIIAAVTACIAEGINTKMKLAGAAAKRAGISKRTALQIIEKYTGTDPAVHRWKFDVRERGAKVFMMLPAPTASPGHTPG